MCLDCAIRQRSHFTKYCLAYEGIVAEDLMSRSHPDHLPITIKSTVDGRNFFK
jgi:hypothetical protein